MTSPDSITVSISAPQTVQQIGYGSSSWSSLEELLAPDFPHGHGVADDDLAPPQFCDCGAPLGASDHDHERLTTAGTA